MQHFAVEQGPGGIGLVVQPLLGEAIQLVLRADDTSNLIAESYGTTVTKLRGFNPVLQLSAP